jgi:prephenate dehydrogenase
LKPTVAVVGLGLIGGSLARALTRAGYTVVGVDRPRVLRLARRAHAVARTAATVERAAADADVVVLAASPATNLRLLRRVARAAPFALVTDVGSVKVPIARVATSLGLRFVGGHPLAGNEGSGFTASDAGLFRGRAWVLTPVAAAASDVARVRRLVKAVGARPRTLTPAQHDRAVAFLSHVPQILAWALRDAARGDRVAARQAGIAGPAYRDMTRLARSPRSMWREILAQNRREVTRALAAVRRRLRRRP